MLNVSQCMSLLHFCMHFGDSVFKVGGERRLVFDVAADHPYGADVEMRSGVLPEVFGGGHEHPYRIVGEYMYAQMSLFHQFLCPRSGLFV